MGRLTMRQVRMLVVAMLVSWPVCAWPADLAPMPPRSAAPANVTPLSAPEAACREWTDDCRVCQRAQDGSISCSNVGIACVPREPKCVRR